MRELCPRSYDVVERAELLRLRVSLFASACDENPSVSVTISQDPDIGIPGVVYDCAIVLAQFVAHQVLAHEKEDTSASSKPTPRTTHILELGAGTGTCGLLLASCCAAKGVPVHLTLSDRNANALALASRNAASARDQSPYGRLVTTQIRKYAFGEDPCCLRAPQNTRPPDIILASDVLYDPTSAFALAESLRAMLVGNDDDRAKRVLDFHGDGSHQPDTDANPPQPVCYLAYRPRDSSAHKTNAFGAFTKRLREIGLAAREETVDARSNETKIVTADASTATPADDANETRENKWSVSFNVRDATARGLTILRIEAGGRL
mmetsp:Transcript_5369/g.20128  ORF Transcript_5369/g.20128 Transcript_5369/m.20128 type:complete len:321 (+) Transcript_5369:181-1143(+)